MALLPVVIALISILHLCSACYGESLCLVRVDVM